MNATITDLTAEPTATPEALGKAIGLDHTWTPGKPPWVTESTHKIDLQIGKRSRCPGCKRGRRMISSFFKIDGFTRRYKIIARCHCGAAQEL